MKVLIADDDPIARLLLASVLESLKYEVVSCADGEEAWRSFCEQPTRIVISDWRMPVRDGLELCRLIREKDSERTFFMLCSSACNNEESELCAWNAGVDGILRKPLDRNVLGPLLAEADRNFRLRGHECA